MLRFHPKGSKMKMISTSAVGRIYIYIYIFDPCWLLNNSIFPMVEIPMMPSIILRVCASTMPKDESMLPSLPISPIHTEHLDIKVSTSKALAGWSMRSSTTCKHRDHCGFKEFCWLHQLRWKKALVVFRGVRSPKLWNTICNEIE